MKCFNHKDIDAVSICISCGKALCNECLKQTSKGKNFCSPDCEDFLKTFESTIETIHAKTLKQNKISAYGCFICGVIFTLFGLFNLFLKPFFLPLAIFMILLGIAFFLWGSWYLKVGKKLSPNKSMEAEAKDIAA